MSLLTTTGNHGHTHGLTGGTTTTSRNAKAQFGPAGDYRTLNTDPWGGLGYAALNFSGGAVRRGGSYGSKGRGLFSVMLNDTRDRSRTYEIGFRCVYRKFTTICTQGQYLPAGSISLNDCTHPRDGYYAVNDAEIICPEGTYSSGSSARTECTVHECTTAGQFLPEGSTSPSDCKDASRGHYSDSDSSKGSTEAKCIAGTAESASGARTSCSLCPPNKYQPGTGKTSCVPCPQGQYPSDDRRNCKNPEPGHYTLYGVKAACPSGTISQWVRSNQILGLTVKTNQCFSSQCLTEGQVLPEGSSSTSDCRDAKAGHYAGGSGTYKTVETPCPAGTAERNAGARISCDSCPKGFYSLIEGQTSCAPCIYIHHATWLDHTTIQVNGTDVSTATVKDRCPFSCSGVTAKSGPRTCR